MIWLESENVVGKNFPKWVRSVGISEDGTVFVPAAIAGNEQEVFLCTAYDGAAVATYRNHVFVPATWLAKEFPDAKELCEIMENRAKAEIANGILKD